MSSARHDTQIGNIYWCDTARASVGERFSEKERRPVLVVAVEGFSAAVYPCSTRRDERYESEYLGRVYFDLDTHLVFGLGLFDAPIDALYEPVIPWKDWRSWERRHRDMIADDLERLRTRLRERKSLARNDPSGASIAS